MMNELQRKEAGLQERLTNKTFKLDSRYKDGYFSDDVSVIDLRIPNRVIISKKKIKKKAEVASNEMWQRGKKWNVLIQYAF